MADFAVQDVLSAVDRLAPSFGVDPGVAKSLLIAENTKDGKLRSATWSGSATNKNNTMGVGQVIPSTAEGLKQAGLLPATWKFDPDDLDSQVSASLAAVKDMRSRLRNPDDPFELGAYYNGGTRGWKAYQEGKPLVPETAQYLQKMRTGMAELNMTPQQIERAAASGTSGSGQRSSQTRSTTSSSVFDPAAMSNFQNMAGLVQNTLIPNAMGALTDRGSEVQVVGQDLISSILTAGNDAAEAAGARAMLEATGQARRAAILTRANLNPEVELHRAAQAQDQLDATSVALDNLRPEIDARMSVGFFDNPLEWLVNQTRLPGMVSEYNNLVRVQQDTMSRYGAAADLARSTIDLSTAIDADQTLVAGNALAKAEASKAAAKAKEVQLQLSSKSAADALAAVQLGMQASNLSLQQLQLTRESQRIQEGESQAAFERRQLEQQGQDLNLMIKAAGGAGIDMTRFKQLPAATREQLMQTVSSKKFGKDFVSALGFIQEFGDLNAMAEGGQLGVRTWVNDTQRAASAITLEQQTKAANNMDKSFNPQKAQMNNLNAVAAQYEAQANVDMRVAADANPFKADYKNTPKLPELQNNIIAATIQKYGPGGPEQMWDKVDEQQLLKRAVTDIKMSTNPAEATKKYANDIAQFYQVSAKQQAMNTKWALFGLGKPNKTYAVQLPQFQSGNKTVDLGNPAEVENILTRRVASEIALQNLSIFAVGERLSVGKKLGPNQ